MIAKPKALRLPPILALASLVIALLGGAAFVSESRLFLERQVEREAAASVSRSLARALQGVQGMETGQRGYLLTGRDDYLRPFERGSRQARAELARLASLSDPRDALWRERLSELISRKESELRRTIHLNRSGRHEDAMDIVLSDEGRLDMMAIRALVDEQSEALGSRQAQLLSETQARLRASKIAFFLWTAFLGLLLGVALLSSRFARLRLVEVTRRLAEEATHDPLTRLPNRRYLSQWLASAVEASQRSGEPLAALYLDLDGFSQINNTLGHDAGDAALLAACSAFRPLLRARDFLARVGGDEFVIVSPGSSADAAARLGQNLVDALENLAPVQGSPVGLIGVSVGVAAFPQSPDAQALLSDADAAMYDAKRAGKRRVSLAPLSPAFHPGMAP